ncbi:MAG: hypothetical protein AABY53_10120 [Bdellovibrionota bacterium]
MKRILIDTRCVLLISASLLALNANAGNEWFEFYNNTRSLGMGGASIAITSDDTSLFRNPASLGSIRDIYGTVFDPEIEGTGNLSATSTDVGPLIATLGAKPNTYYRAKQQVSPVLVRRNVGFGFLYKNEISAEISSADLTVMNTAYVSDLAVVLGANWRIADGRIKIGVSGRFLNRIEVQNATLAVAGPTDLATIGSEGSAIALDGGILFQAPWTYLPTLGLVAHDIGSTVFDKQDGFRLRTATRPATVPQSVDVALAIFPIHSNRFRSVWTLEYSDIANSRNDTDTAKRTHFGIEFNTSDIFFFRLGYNQRYVTGGFEVASENVVWQVSSYGEEIGTSLAPREDRRLSMKFALRF